MKIRMLQDANGADDGITLRQYRKGQEYDLPNTERGLDLARVFIRERWAEEVFPPAPEVKPEDAPEDKAVWKAPYIRKAVRR